MNLLRQLNLNMGQLHRLAMVVNFTNIVHMVTLGSIASWWYL